MSVQTGLSPTFESSPTLGRAWRVVYIYHPNDQSYRDALDKQLLPLQKKGLIETWHDRLILPGDHRQSEIDSKVNQADVLLVLLSSDLTPYLYGPEMELALKRHQANQARLIPILVRPVAWEELPIIGKLQLLPDQQDKAVIEFDDLDRAWVEVVRGIRRIAQG